MSEAPNPKLQAPKKGRTPNGRHGPTECPQKSVFMLDWQRWLRYTLSVLKFLAVITSACLFGSLNVRAADPTPDTSQCGPFPKLYKDITWRWMQKNLVDADSAKVEWQGDPQCTDIGKDGQHEYGWLLNFTINSRNRFGLYTGKQQHVLRQL